MISIVFDVKVALNRQVDLFIVAMNLDWIFLHERKFIS